MNKIRYVVRRGKSIGTVLTPHIHENGSYVVSKTRFKSDYIYEKDEAKLIEWVARGYSVRMSNLESNHHHAPSLISPNSIEHCNP